MINISDDERRRIFSIWLRTGRLDAPRNADGIELKFNPWHDPKNGRFAFAGSGQYHGQWGGGVGAGGGWLARLARPKSQKPTSHPTPKAATRAAAPSNRGPSPQTPAPDPAAKGTWAGGGFTGGGGGEFGGVGATAKGTWGRPDPKRAPASSHGSTSTVAPTKRAAATSGVPARSANSAGEQYRSVVRNGYTYQIDARDRTRRVSGVLTVAASPIRSRTSQRQAGGAERRAKDDGGHYIAARFNGPTEAFNHFAQEANFNRGSYRLLEDEWARAKRAGKRVTVKIAPQFDGESVRPSIINVWWTIDGDDKSRRFPNQRSEKSRGK